MFGLELELELEKARKEELAVLILLVPLKEGGTGWRLDLVSRKVLEYEGEAVRDRDVMMGESIVRAYQQLMEDRGKSGVG